jgi:hypothetical protein
VPASTSYSRCSSSASAVFPHPRAPTIAAIAPGAIVSEHVCKRGTCCAICVSMLIYEWTAYYSREAPAAPSVLVCWYIWVNCIQIPQLIDMCVPHTNTTTRACCCMCMRARAQCVHARVLVYLYMLVSVY